MNQTARRRRTRVAKVDAAGEIAALTQARDTLLDVLNAVLAKEGGTIVVPAVLVEASSRRHVAVTRKPFPDRYVIAFADLPEKDDRPSIIERLKHLGMKPA